MAHLVSPLAREPPPTPCPNSPDEPSNSFSRSRLLRLAASRERPLSALAGGVRLKSDPVSGAPSGVAGAEAVSIGRRSGDWSALEGYGCRHIDDQGRHLTMHAHQDPQGFLTAV